MKISIVATSELYEEPKAFKIDKKTKEIKLTTPVSHLTTKQEHMREVLEKISGCSANVCYTNKSMDEILTEDLSSTQKRLDGTISAGHHSVCDHPNITLYLENIPKLFAMILNNEKDYATSEKSARYAPQNWQENESGKLCLKWQGIVKDKIDENYSKDIAYLDENRRNKLAQENGRYFMSILEPTTKMVHTLSWRQLNYEYHWLKNLVEKDEISPLFASIKPSMKEFCTQIENLGLVSDKLVDGKERTFSLISEGKKIDEKFDINYQTTYKGSFAQVAQAQRHRSIDYTISIPKDFEMYIPEIIKDDKNLVEEYKEDAELVKQTYPQGMLVDVVEKGDFETFKWKMEERKCARAQNEIRVQTDITAKKYYESLKSVDEEQAQIMAKYLKGSRCTFPNYKCREYCGWKEGITGERKI